MAKTDWLQRLPLFLFAKTWNDTQDQISAKEGSVHTAKVVKTFLDKNDFKMIDHPPYSPDLAPADYFLFPTVKSALAGKTIPRREFQKTWERVVATIPKERFAEAYQKWYERQSKCVTIQGDYELRTDFMSPSVPTIWLELDLPGVRRLLIGGVYRQWSSAVAATSSSSSISGLGMEREELDIITHQLQSATLAAKAVVVMGILIWTRTELRTNPIADAFFCTPSWRVWRPLTLSIRPLRPLGDPMANLPMDIIALVSTTCIR
eukprot:maker-scaffold1885_size25651-snap-gene-0.2 protein:Tk05538 transcript:maker-scaffold1885_size25651-snap-gene-0.2-mRNA-1 annotation:"histone-lysine n-methyltransferase setmar"